MTELRASRVELELTASQRRWCERACAASRVAYNWGLAEWRRWYRWQRIVEGGHEERATRLLERWGGHAPDYNGGPSAFGVHGRLTAEKKRDGSQLQWLGEIKNAYVVRESIAALGTAYAAFFRRLKKHRSGDHSECGRGKKGRCSLGMPRFHSRRHDEGFHVDQGSALQSRTVYTSSHKPRGELYVPGLGWVRTVRGQQLPAARFDAKATAKCICGATAIKHKSGCQAKLTKKDRDAGKEPGSCTCGSSKLEHDKACPARRSSGAWVGDAEICGVGIRRWGGRWYASLRVRESVTSRERKPNTRMAVEVGVRYRAVTYTESAAGNAVVGCFADTRTDKKLASLERRRKLWERRMARRHQRGVKSRDQSRGWHEARAEVAKYHRRIAQVRADRIHFASRAIVNSGTSELVVRDMAVRDLLQRGTKMTKAEKQARNVLAHDVHQAGMFELKRQLEYKQLWAGGTTTTIARDVPETRVCSQCGAVQAQAPGYPWFACRECGHAADRDTNAAQVRYNYRTHSCDPVADRGTPETNGGSNPTNGRENRGASSHHCGGASPDRSGKGASKDVSHTCGDPEPEGCLRNALP